ncbi:Uncharacterised protein [Actinomyces bovis]|uniref:Uncharacterized protein n=1 Tax=Actinomyces bovis TaxID=1658 RepID=A0ABY1VPT3_9ACTO|nr:hypothetical protein [Actinomyces bovis]SPT53687.1 Uncharacterised protein [Actinomyces bovis]VEG55804.1 Uncharacterised protein [Actinomyces israelii]
MANIDTKDWSNTDLNVLYDIFFETGTRLGGEFVALGYAAESAGDEEQAQFWRDEDMRMMRERSAVDSSDREAIIAQMKAFDREWRYLRYAQGERAIA